MVTQEVIETVAKRVAWWWLRRGVTGYAYDDLYQDALEICYKARERYNPTHGKPEPYLTKCCKKKIGDRVVRASKPVSARSNNDVVKLRDIKSVQVSDSHEDHFDLEYIVWLTQVRERMLEVVGKQDHIPLMIALGVFQVRDLATNKTEASKLQQAVRRVRRRLSRDPKLCEISKEIPSG